MAKASSPLSVYLAVAYGLLAVYGSLYPFAGWHDSGAPLDAFLTSGWPRYTTWFDIFLNLLAYLPLGFLWTTACQLRLPPVQAVIAAFLAGVALSLGLETLQNFLPSRVPSIVDFVSNGLGTLVGALAGARWGRSMLDGGRLHILRHRLFKRDNMTDAGLLLLGLWFLTQLNPDTLLFGNGGLRSLFDLEHEAPLEYSASGFIRIEAAVVAAHTLAIALAASLLVRQAKLVLPLGLLAAALLAKSFAFLLLLNGISGLAWATPGSLAGLAFGVLAWLCAGLLAVRWQRVLAAVALLLGTVLVNIAPQNPYLANTFQLWDPGQFLNFHGLTRLASTVWPFLALPWLILTRADHEPRHR